MAHLPVEERERLELDRTKVIRVSIPALSVIVRENRAEAKDRGRRFTSIFLPYKSRLKRLSTVVFSEVGGFFILR